METVGRFHSVFTFHFYHRFKLYKKQFVSDLFLVKSRPFVLNILGRFRSEYRIQFCLRPFSVFNQQAG